MRPRFPLSVLIVAILVVATFAALNWAEFLRPVPLSFGPLIMDAPLGLLMLGLLIVTLLVFLVTNSISATRHHHESRHHLQQLEAQRELADKAEASRFTELRNHLDTQLRELRQRDAIAATEFEKAMVQGQRELRTQLEQMNRAVSSRLGELESRLDARLAQLPGAPASPARTALTPISSAVSPVHDDTGTPSDETLGQAREQRHYEARLQEEREYAERKRNEPAIEAGEVKDPPQTTGGANVGWRRWF